MKKLIFFFFLLLSCLFSFSQGIFKPGYFVNNEEKRVDCLIKNANWDKNPTKFQYKLARSSNRSTATIDSIREFGLTGGVTFIRYTGPVEQSSELVHQLSEEKKPLFKEETVFLKLLVDGKATLYYYKGVNQHQFFYSINGTEIQQLIYKKYRDGDLIKENRKYTQQLYDDLKCDQLSIMESQKVAYNVSALSAYFRKYNQCSTGVVIPKKKYTQGVFSAKLKIGVSMPSVTLYDIDLDKEVPKTQNSIIWGFEAEYFLPFHKRSWSFFGGFSAMKFESNEMELAKYLKYSPLDWSIGMRRYLVLKEKASLFLSAAVQRNLIRSSSRLRENDNARISLDPSTNFCLGAGFTNRARHTLEVRWQSRRDFLSKSISLTGTYDSFDIMYSYSFW